MKLAALLLTLASGVATAQPAAPAPAPTPAAPATPAQPAAKAATPLAKVETRGKGPVTLILVPGLMCDWTVFDRFMDRNKDAYTMLAVTLPGFGGSTAPTPPTSPTAPGAAKDFRPSANAWLNNAELAILDLIDEKKLDKPILVGHSLGGHLAARLAAKHPGKFRGAISIDGFPAFPLSSNVELSESQRQEMLDGDYGRKMLTAPADGWPDQVRGWIRTMVTSQERAKELGDAAAKIPRDTTVRYMTELFASDATEEVRASTCPTLFLAALPDREVATMSDGLARTTWQRQVEGAKHATLVFFEQTRHFIMDDAPAEFDRAVKQFVAGEKVEGKIDTSYTIPDKPLPTAEPAKPTPPAVKPNPRNEPEQPRR